MPKQEVIRAPPIRAPVTPMAARCPPALLGVPGIQIWGVLMGTMPLDIMPRRRACERQISTTVAPVLLRPSLLQYRSRLLPFLWIRMGISSYRVLVSHITWTWFPC